jgi:multicomponent Na+:H+ antiporter subunit F
MTLLEVSVTATLVMVSVAYGLAFVRLVRGPSLADRVVGLDLMAVFAMGMAVALSVATGKPAFMDVAIIVALLGFLGTVAFAYYLERRR